MIPYINWARFIIPTLDLSHIPKSLLSPIFYSPKLSLIYLQTTRAFLEGKNLLKFLGKNLNLLLNYGVFKDILPFSKNDKDYTFCKQVYKSSWPIKPSLSTSIILHSLIMSSSLLLLSIFYFMNSAKSVTVAKYSFSLCSNLFSRALIDRLLASRKN